MAGTGIQVFEIFAVVTQQSPATTTLRPTIATETDDSVSNPAHAIDGDVASYAELSDPVSAEIELTAFENTQLVSDAGRDWVELTVTADWDSAVGSEFATLMFRGISTDNWTSLDASAGGVGWDGSARTFDIASAAGTNLEADWQLALQLLNGTGTLRLFDVRVEVGGDVVAPTAAEIAEDVEALGVAKFTGWYDRLVAAVEAALVEFGGTPAERDAILNEVRDETTAADANAVLTISAARAEAEAYEETATALGIPRFAAAETE